ncbi:hypothetical protein B0O99DRAFT_30444 [Bisporella sp. PMI_857]|nr:hypothetical protein B0O99DRAFT_30444 [Bisporella sp. PMI_857]
MADFGLAQEVPQVQDDLYMRQFSGYGTRPYHLPEQTKICDGMTDQSRPWNMTRNNLLQNVRYSSASNVWQLGLIMWCLKREKMEPPWPRGGKKGLQLHQSTRSNRLKNSGPTLADQYDIDDESPSANPKYSRGLSALIAECLLIRPAERPNAAQLMARTGRGLEYSRIANATVLSKPDINIPEPGSPQLSAEWLVSGTTPLMAPGQSQGYLRPSELFNEYEKNWVEARRNKGRKVWQKKPRLRFDGFEMREISNALPDVDREAPQQPQRKPPVVPPRPVRNKIPLRHRRAPTRPIVSGNTPSRPHLSPPEQGFNTGKPALPQGPRQQIPMTGNTTGLFGMQPTRPYVPPTPLPIITGRQAPYQPPAPRPKKSKIVVPRSLLSSTKKPAPGPATGNLQPSPPGPPTAGRMNNFNQIMAEIHVPGFLGTSTKRVVRLRRIHPNLTILMLRRRIDQENCGIPFGRIEIQCNGMKFHDNQLVGELPARFPDQLVGRIEVVQAAGRA